MARKEKSRHRVTAHRLLAALRHRYSAPEWVLMSQIRDAAGFSATRTADAVVMNMWPSRGLELHGFELKTTRSDWISEMRNPDKSRLVQEFCDRWWLVVSDKAIVKGGELPATWGLLVLRGRYLSCQTPAPKLTTKVWDRTFIASLIHRASHESSASHLYREAQEMAYQRGMKDAEKRFSHDAKSVLDSRKRLKDIVAEFENRSGVSIHHPWRIGDIGESVKLIMDMMGQGMETRIGAVRETADDLQTLVADLVRLAELLEAMPARTLRMPRVRFDA